MLNASQNAAPHDPELFDLWDWLAPHVPPPVARPVADSLVPVGYAQLLVHHGHMTETLEAHHAGPVALHVLAQRHTAHVYGRMLTLSVANPPRVVMFGLMRINLRQVSATVAAEILGGVAPLGRILIDNNVLRCVEYHRCLAIEASDHLAAYISLPTYGRLARIHCDGQPAVELLEIVTGQTPRSF